MASGSEVTNYLMVAADLIEPQNGNIVMLGKQLHVQSVKFV